MCILDLSKVVMYKFHHDYIRHKYDISTGLLFTDTGILIYEIKMKMYVNILVRIKKCLILAIILLSQNMLMIQVN